MCLGQTQDSACFELPGDSGTSPSLASEKPWSQLRFEGNQMRSRAAEPSAQVIDGGGPWGVRGGGMGKMDRLRTMKEADARECGCEGSGRGEAGKKPVWFHTIRNTRGEAS